VISGDDAYRLGMVTHLHEDPLQARSRSHVRSLRNHRTRCAVPSGCSTRLTGTPAETLALEAKLQGELIGTANQLTAVTAGLAKQEPEFTDPV